MANQSWITESNLGEFEEESKITGININYTPTTEYGHTTVGPTLISSSLPSTLYISEPENNNVRLYGDMPKVTSDTSYYFTLRLTEKDSLGNIVRVDDRYFKIVNQNNPVTWNEEIDTFVGYNESAFEQSLVSCLNNPNGNETFRKISGTFPTGLSLSDNGVISGYIEEDITEITSYEFTVKVYVNNVELESCGPRTFSIDIDPGSQETKPFWVTSEGYIGNANKNEGVTNISISAMDLSGQSGTIKYKLAESTDEHITSDITGLPPGLTLTSKGAITGFTTTSQVKKWYFGAYAYKYIELEDNYVYSDYRKFYINTNAVSAEHEITWIDEDTTYNLGSYCVGEDISGKLPEATTIDGSTVTYYFSGDTYPKGMVLSKDGVISGNLALQKYGTYTFEVMAKTQYTYITRKFKVELKAGMTDYALRLFLKINLEYKDEYNEIKSQLNPNTTYHESLSNYNVDTFPTIDVATLKCYDKEVLASMMNFGNAEVVRFGLTKYLEHTQVDNSGSVVDNYEVYYKSIDESTYQWDELSIGDYDFEAKLQQLKDTNDIDEDAELDFNNETYDTYTYGGNIVGKVSTYAKLLAIDTDELNTGDYVIVSLDETNNYTQNYYKLKNDGTWLCMGVSYPNELLTTDPRLTYNVFNFKNVRDILSEKIYTYQVEGTHYYDYGNQQLIKSVNITDKKKLYKVGKEYYISNLDDTNATLVTYQNGIVYQNGGHIITNTLFIPTFDSVQFVIITDENGIYHLNQITNPWCFDFSRNGARIKIDTIPEDAEMVLPYITTCRKLEEDAGISLSDSNIIIEDKSLGSNIYYTQFLDVEEEPLPMWKRESAESWKANTTYKTGDIITYASTYYKVKQQFTSGETFVFDSNLLEVLNGEDVNSLLSKNYFPTLDLGYYEVGTNRMYLKNLNAAEKEGDFWYRRDFLFWEMIGEPLYTSDVDTFGIPFYSNVNPLESMDRSIKNRKFEIVCDTPDVTVTITTSPTSYEITHKGNSWYVIVPNGTYIDWSVTAEGYYPEGGSYPIVSDEKNIISLAKKCTITVYPTPEDAKVTLTADGYEQGRLETTTYQPLSITGINPWLQTGTYYIDYDNPTKVYDDGVKVYNEVYDENLTRQYYNSTLFYRCIDTGVEGNERYLVDIPGIVTLTITPTPSDATVTLTAEGYTQSGNTITVPIGTRVKYEVSKDRYSTETSSVVVNSNRTVNVELASLYATLTVAPNPSDATVTLTCTGYTQSGNSITVEKNKTVTYNVEKTGYVSTSGYEVVTKDKTLDIELEPYVTLTINPTPSDATVVLTAEGYTQVGNTITVRKNTEISYVVSKTRYMTLTGTTTIDDDKTLDVSLESFVTLTITPTPSDATVTLTCTGYEQEGNTITVPPRSAVTYKVAKTNYYEEEGEIIVDKTMEREIEIFSYPTLTIVPTPSDATVVLTVEGYTQVGNTITTPANTAIECVVSSPYYAPYEAALTMGKTSSTIKVTLESYVSLAFNVTPTSSGAIPEVTYNGHTYTANFLRLPKNTYVTWKVEAPGYYTKTGELTVTDSMNVVDVELVSKKYTFTIIPTPSDATVTLTAEGYTQSGNSIVVNYNTAVTWKVEKEGLFTRQGSINITSDITKEVELKESYYVDFDGFEYTFDESTGKATLTKYVGNDADVDTPHIGN